jgi:hypothetical protein
MANTSYCRFKNTLLELQNCYDAMLDELNEKTEDEAGLGYEELKAKKRIN